MIVRNAQKTQSYELAKLIEHTAKGDLDHGLDYYAWSQSAVDGQDPYQVGSDIIASEQEKYTYNNIRIIECEGKIAALALSYIIVKKTKQELEAVLELFKTFSILVQTVVGSYYLDSFVVEADFRGKGFSRVLLADTIEVARKSKARDICLLCFEQNTLALGLYEKYGFKITNKAKAICHPALPYQGNILLLTKPL
jgi:ribosomal protein S18 acetylase RimI-like enzyme